MSEQYQAENQQHSEPVGVERALCDREIELLNRMIEAQLNHAQRCDEIANRTLADKQKAWDMERVALLRKVLAVMGA